jgi:hypothetical protein
VVTGFDIVVAVAGAGAGSTTVRTAGADPVVAADGDAALRWITTVRCFTMGFNGFAGCACPGAAAAVDAEDVPIPQFKLTAVAPAANEAASPPAVSTADRLFIARSFWIVGGDAREPPFKGPRSDGQERVKGPGGAAWSGRQRLFGSERA